MTELDWPPNPVDDMALERKPKVCKHQWFRFQAASEVGPGEEWVECRRCSKRRDEVQARRGKQSRNYGNRAELEAARRYGGTKVGAAGGPVDIRGVDWNTQMKTHRRKPPTEWTKAFSGMAANRERMPRLLLRFVGPGGVAPDDYFVVRGSDWLAWHGKDESPREER